MKSILKIALFIGIFFLALVIWRIWLVNYLFTFVFDIVAALPLRPETAALIQTGIKFLIYFLIPGAIISFVLFNRNHNLWIALIVTFFVFSIVLSWWSNKDPGVNTHCYVIRPDIGLTLGYVDKNGNCPVDHTSGLQMKPVTREIQMCIQASEDGKSPHRLGVANIDADNLFDGKTGRSLYWFHRNSTGNLDFFDGPGFDPASLVPLESITNQNAENIGQYIKQQQSILKAAAEEAEQKRVQAEQEEAQKKQAEEAEQKRVQAEQEEAQKKQAEEAEQKEAQKKQAEEVERKQLIEEQNRIASDRQQREQYSREQQTPQVFLTITNLDCHYLDYYLNDQLIATVKANSFTQLAVRAETYTARACLQGTSNCGPDTIYTINNGTFNVTITRNPTCQSANGYGYGYVNNRLAQPVMRVIPMWAVRHTPIWRR